MVDKLTPKRGDLVRFIKKNPNVFTFDCANYLVQLL